MSGSLSTRRMVVLVVSAVALLFGALVWLSNVFSEDAGIAAQVSVVQAGDRANYTATVQANTGHPVDLNCWVHISVRYLNSPDAAGDFLLSDGFRLTAVNGSASHKASMRLRFEGKALTLGSSAPDITCFPGA